jgi:hypothetical protein
MRNTKVKFTILNIILLILILAWAGIVMILSDQPIQEFINLCISTGVLITGICAVYHGCNIALDFFRTWKYNPELDREEK